MRIRPIPLLPTDLRSDPAYRAEKIGEQDDLTIYKIHMRLSRELLWLTSNTVQVADHTIRARECNEYGECDDWGEPPLITPDPLGEWGDQWMWLFNTFMGEILIESPRHGPRFLVVNRTGPILLSHPRPEGTER